MGIETFPAPVNIAYLDYASTSPMRPESIEVLAGCISDQELFGNPSGSHSISRRAKYALEEAREEMAYLLGARASEVVFTSGGTESANMAIRGTLAAVGGTAVCGATEHHAVLRSCEHSGGRVARVDSQARVGTDCLSEALDQDVSIVSVMLANNETGVTSDIDSLASCVDVVAPGAVFHTDAVAAFSCLDVSSLARRAKLISLSAHKFGGPKGVGILVARSGTQMESITMGGSQEFGLRSGTQNVPAILAAVAAAKATVQAREEESVRIGGLRDRLLDGILSEIPTASETVSRELTISSIAHFCFPGVENEELLIALDSKGVCASAGSACASGAIEPSHVLLAMGLTPTQARSAIRFSLGWSTTRTEIDHAIASTVQAVAELGGGNTANEMAVEVSAAHGGGSPA